MRKLQKKLGFGWTRRTANQGLIFCLIILIIILSIVVKTLLQVLKINNPYKIIAISGLTCSFGLQSLINILSSLAMIPTKGMTLPFVSYGGSSMLATMLGISIVMSTKIYRRQLIA